MPITQEELAERLKDARIGLDLTQDEVAERMDMKRPTIVQIEGGKRAVTSIELSRFATVYKRTVELFLAETAPQAVSGIVHLRSHGDLGEPVDTELNRCIDVCRAATNLEATLRRPRGGVPFSYTWDRPRNRWDAVDQGMRLASLERRRLKLGLMPVRNIVEIIAQHGVRVGRYTLTDDLSGLFFVGPDTGMAILVNSAHSTARRLFSYAHEYCHLLVDSTHTPGGVSRFANRDDLLEVRANVFSVHFLMPDAGVRSFLDGIGSPSRQVAEVYDGFSKPNDPQETVVTAQRRSAPGEQEVGIIDVLHVARHFGTSFEATVYHLLNLKMISKEAQETLLADRDRADYINHKFLGPLPEYLEQETAADVKQMTVNLVVEAWLQEQISAPKAHEYLRLVDIDPQSLQRLVAAA